MFGHSKAEVLSKNRAGDFAFLQVRAAEISNPLPYSRLNNSNWDVCLNVVSVRGLTDVMYRIGNAGRAWALCLLEDRNRGQT